MITSTEQACFRVSVASGDALDTREFKVQERMSALFSVTVSVVAHDADLDFEAIVGQPASFEVEASAERRRTWTGICKELHQVAAEESGLSSYQIEIVPTLWLATQRRNHRIFQGLSDVDIATALMAEWGVVPVKKLSGAYKKRKYRVQYGESDYAFICRLLEDAGVSFYFMDAAGSTMLVLSDAPHADAPRETLIPFRDHPSDADREHVTAVRIGRRLRPGRYAMRDHDYRRPPSFKLMGTAALASGVEEKLEEFHFAPGAFLFEGNGDATPHADDRGQYRADPAEGDAMARRRLEAKRSEALTCAFETNALDLAPGVVFGMRWHPQRDLGDDRRLLVTASTMSGTTGQRWKHACEARSAATPFRPALTTPKPTVRGVESATVVGPPGEEIHTDEFGRVRAHFHWDRESRMNDESSCWIHVSQSWGGAMFGGVNLPRVGQEVLVDFLGGDPDRPVIVGRVYTNLQRVPYKLPENKTQSGWKSCSTGGAGGYNEIMFEDAAGEELLRVQAERDLQKLVKRDERATIGRDRATRIGHDERRMVGHSRATQIGVVDSNLVGETYSVMVAPPSEGGGNATSLVMVHEKIVLDTGAGATITLERDKITLAAEVIEIHARDHMDLRGKKKGIDLHAPKGATNFFTGKKFSVDTDEVTIAGKKVGICASGALEIDGSPVKINGPGQPSARQGDPAGGTIQKGSANVLVGEGAVTTGLGKDVDALVKKSATLTKNLKDLHINEKDGWKVKYGKAGEGSFCDRKNKEIVLDPNDKGDPNTLTQTLAHESGHALYTPDPQVPPDGLTKQQYVDTNTNSALKDEGEATLTNAKVRDEILKDGGPDIGISGKQSDKYEDVYKKYPDPKDRDKARQEIGNLFADGEHPSTDPSKTYRDYYSQSYKDHWDSTHP